MQLNELQHDALTELINIGVGKGAETLNSMLSSHISLTVPKIEIYSISSPKMKELVQSDGQRASISMTFRGNLTGKTFLSFSSESASVLLDAIIGDTALCDDEDEMDALRASTLVEVGNIVMNGVLGSLSNGLGTHLQYSVPQFEECSLSEMIEVDKADEARLRLVLFATTRFTSPTLNVDGEVFLLFELESFEELVGLLEQQIENLMQEYPTA